MIILTNAKFVRQRIQQYGGGTLRSTLDVFDEYQDAAIVSVTR